MINWLKFICYQVEFLKGLRPYYPLIFVFVCYNTEKRCVRLPDTSPTSLMSAINLHSLRQLARRGWHLCLLVVLFIVTGSQKSSRSLRVRSHEEQIIKEATHTV